MTLSEHALPPHSERLVQIIRFLSNMRQRLLSMTRRVQEKPCWSLEEELVNGNIDDTIEQLVNFHILKCLKFHWCVFF